MFHRPRDKHMPLSSHLAKTLITASVISVIAFLCSLVQAAADIDYLKIGWWHITYREVGDVTGCDAWQNFRIRQEFR
jgi:hypothetical protein